MRFAPLAFRLFLLVLLLSAGLGLYEWSRGHPQDMPWTRLSLAEPVGRFTTFKLSRLRDDPAQCRALLDEAGQPYERIAAVTEGANCGYADGVRLGPRSASGFRPPATVACGLAAGLFLWRHQVVEPAAEKYFGRKVTRIDQFGSYNCRHIRSTRGDGGWSEHARANAIDIAGFRLSDGERITVAADWTGHGAKAAFLRDVRNGACRIFGTTLSPDYNELHRDHLHLDQANRGGWSFCR